MTVRSVTLACGVRVRDEGGDLWRGAGSEKCRFDRRNELIEADAVERLYRELLTDASCRVRILA